MGKSDKTHDELKFLDGIGQKATVQRETLSAEAAQAPNRKLCELGLALQDDASLKLRGYRYMGSAAVHIYAHDTLGLMDFVSQTAPLDIYRCPEVVASKAFDDLLQAMKETYNHKRSRLRSGF